MSFLNMSTGDAHMNGDCWPPSCPVCEVEDAVEDGERGGGR